MKPLIAVLAALGCVLLACLLNVALEIRERIPKGGAPYIVEVVSDVEVRSVAPMRVEVANLEPVAVAISRP